MQRSIDNVCFKIKFKCTHQKASFLEYNQWKRVISPTVTRFSLRTRRSACLCTACRLVPPLGPRRGARKTSDPPRT